MVWILNPSREQRTVGERDKGMEENEAGSTPKVNFEGVLWQYDTWYKTPFFCSSSPLLVMATLGAGRSAL